MTIDKNHPEECWISFILRTSVALLFAMAAYGKFAGGLEAFATGMVTAFKDTILPVWLLTPYVNVLAYAEAFVAIWLLVGVNLRKAWIFTSLLLMSLAFGLMLTKQSAADIYILIAACCAGIYVGKYDKCVLKLKK